MKRLLGALLLVIGLAAPGVRAQSPLVVQDQGVTLEFPDRLTFKAHVAGSAGIDRVILEYGVEKLTCGTVIAKAFPHVDAGSAADVSWTWEMHKSGSEPPGARIWYRWRATDKAGHETVSDKHDVLWLDHQHAWQSLTRDKLTLHWYAGSSSFAQGLLDSAVGSLQQLKQTTGVVLAWPTDLYIYDNTAAMQGAVLYQPGWTGGLAYPTNDIVLIGISPQQVDWGKRTEAHELTHVLVGHLAFSCLSSIPTWLNEGIAVYGEGGPEASSRTQLQQAISANKLMSVRSLSGGFSEDPGKADLSYSESYSLVNFLITQYGQPRIIKLFGDLRDGMKIDDALSDAEGLSLDTLEDRWRTAVGAPPRPASASPVATMLPTAVPTYRPISGAPLPPTAVAAAIPPAAAPGVSFVRSSDLPIIPLLLGGAAAGLVACIAGLVGIFFVLSQRRKHR
ncbi:MAG TPA: peptidase MA family metallohydrolase [Chloroflexia bacterium]|nr:peptidase MA family metallohydrolase [Chloroflexia bacterium]